MFVFIGTDGLQASLDRSSNAVSARHENIRLRSQYGLLSALRRPVHDMKKENLRNSFRKLFADITNKIDVHKPSGKVRLL
jgi:hypothetical protein